MATATVPTGVAADRMLQAGDRVDQATFHAWYVEMPREMRAELIRGRVIVHAALSADHSSHHAMIIGWLFTYSVATPGTTPHDNATTLLSDDSEPQPDAALIVDPACGGATRLEGGYLAGPPELLVEICRSTVAQDLHDKLHDYERYGVQEYVVVLVDDREVRWFAREGQQLVETATDAEGVFRSRVFPGLWLDAPALVDGDAASLIETLRQGLAQPEHAAFASSLTARRQPKPESK